MNRRRTKWTPEINKYIVLSYYIITNLERNNTPYSVELHRRVTDRFPELGTKTIQNILDQRRSLMLNNRLTPTELQQIRVQAEIELGVTQHEDEHSENGNNIHDTQDEEVRENEATRDETSTIFDQLYAKYSEMGVTYRPKLPKLKINGNTKAILNKVDKIIEHRIQTIQNLQELHTLIYIGAVTTLKIHKQEPKLNSSVNKSKYHNRQAPWITRLQKKINDLRRSIGRLTQARREGVSKKTKEKGNAILKRYMNDTYKTDIEIIDYLKQSLAATAKRLRKYQKNYNRHYNRKTSGKMRSPIEKLIG
uniref:Uncharacterized protein n=1 Tax=Anoplophora glabripennis TaxID=217634 RepID=V5I971_ANOGL